MPHLILLHFRIYVLGPSRYARATQHNRSRESRTFLSPKVRPVPIRNQEPHIFSRTSAPAPLLILPPAPTVRAATYPAIDLTPPPHPDSQGLPTINGTQAGASTPAAD